MSGGVAVTGLGAVTPFGSGVGALRAGLREATVHAGPVRAFDTAEMERDVACEVDAGVLEADDAHAARGMAELAAAEAVRERAGALDPARTGLFVGSTMGDIRGSERRALAGGTWQRDLPDCHRRLTAALAEQLGLSGPQVAVTNACAAGNYALALADDELRAGAVDAALVVGVDVLSWIAFVGFASLRAMAPDRCRPFDRGRRGLLLGEGAGALLLERCDAGRPPADARALLLGYGLSCDAHHVSQPAPDGRGAAAAMRAALRMAACAPADVDYMCAHGTGTRLNDLAEARATHAVFGRRAEQLPVSSLKSQVGHSLGAASAIEAIACVLAMEDGIIPATCGYEQEDPEIGLDVVPNRPRRARPRLAMSNSYAFGGNNSSVVLAAL